MDQTKELQEILVEAIDQLNKDAAKQLAVQLAATVEQLRNGDPSKVYLLWEVKDIPQTIKDFIQIHEPNLTYSHAVLLPVGKTTLPFAFWEQHTVELQLPQNKLILVYYR